MQAVRYHEHGDEDVLQVDEIERPEPAADELLVRVEAAAVNPVDTYFRSGVYPLGELPWIPGSDVAGIVESAGAETGFRAGDRVFATGLGKDRQGTCAEYVTVPADLAVPLPDSVDFEAAAAGALVGVTAWQSLFAAGDLSPGDRALVHGGNGGVGHIAVQLAAATGADVTTTARPRYHDKLADLGADVVVDYAEEELADALADLGPYDVILDHRVDEYLGLDCRVAATGGRIAAIGNVDPEACFPSVPLARAKTLSVHHVGMFATPDVAAVLERLGRLFERGAVAPVVDRTDDLDGVADAQRAVLEESFLGKIVVLP